MSHAKAWPFGTKSIRSVSDLETYIEALNANIPLAFTSYYAPDAIFKWSDEPGRTVHEFVDWVLGVHVDVTEKLSLKRAILNGDGTIIAAEVHIQFSGKPGFVMENFAGRFGPVWPGNGPLIKAYVWYTLNKDGHIIEATEDAYLLKAATEPSKSGRSLL